MTLRKHLALIAGVAAASAAQAESVKLNGTFVAEAREVAMARSIAVGRFDGRDGAVFALALERAIANGPPHFELIATGRGRADAVVSGAVTTDVAENDWTRTEKKCAEKDPGGKCVRQEDVKTPCRRRTIELTVDVRVAGDRLLYSASPTKRDEISWCRGEQPSRTVENAVRAMVGGLAEDTARAFVPQRVDYTVRFREGTKGLPKDQQKPFKAAVKQSQRDLPGACAAWGAIDAAAPNHPSVLFDLGLCAETMGDLARADALYRRAAPLMARGNEAEVGADRISRLVAAKQDAARRRP